MRCWASSAASAAAALALAAPAAAAPVDEFADAAGELRRAVSAAKPRAEAAVKQRRDAAAGCADALRATPEPNRDAMVKAYVFDLVGGVFSADGPALRRFATRLERIRLRREPALREARRIVRSEVQAVELLVLELDDTCTVAEQWRAANWRTPPRSLRLQRRLETLTESIPQETDAAEARLRRAGHPRAARILANPLPDGDDLVDPERDPVVCALAQGACP